MENEIKGLTHAFTRRGGPRSAPEALAILRGDTLLSAVHES